jgi:membrane protease YdiL (CAAX protease family)
MEQEKLMSGAYAGVPLTGANLLVAFWNTAVVTALSEEILFRGFLAGLLERRLPLWWANLTQATLFVLPHLLILTVDVRLWPFAVLSPLISGLIFGWLRLRYGSIYPGWIVHGIANFVAVLSMMGG